MAIVRWDPFRELENLQGSISKLYKEKAEKKEGVSIKID